MVNIERHVQTILISLVTGAIFFSAGYMFEGNRSQAIQRTQLDVLTTQVIELRGDFKAMQSNYITRDNFADHEARLRRIEEILVELRTRGK